MSKLDDAIRIRNHAIGLIRSHCGQWDKFGYTTKIGDAIISYRTPFQKMPQPDEYSKYWCTVHGKRAENLPYGLDIHVKSKVMNIEWNDQGEVDIRSFRRGAWEEELLSK